ncbi:uncharacterized protein VDAG_07900 [Verticillium dahliae VdLs.17]|uniref:Uncharacterized protein n=3 Tax=Verticillium TaxID=1036719 RepID=G2XCL8_VERDV|nr:uncharacterized protein VDAG_07900 [Verticillium dahliae VdLs.17]EGY16736.1 hypothetical protein VDAG_07900 [Verticillium dahliae VdLs.17]
MDIEIQQVVVNLLPTMSYTIFPPLDKDPNLQRQSGEPTSHEMLNNDIRRTVETSTADERASHEDRPPHGALPGFPSFTRKALRRAFATFFAQGGPDRRYNPEDFVQYLDHIYYDPDWVFLTAYNGWQSGSFANGKVAF